jgi:choline dehydrogenase-like flavoprotein
MFRWEDHSPADAAAVDWDVVIVGTGMGGAFLGWSLAARGAHVLFLERGKPSSPFNRRSRGGVLKRLLGPDTVEADLALSGRWNRRVSLVQDGRRREFHLPLGSGPGGSSAIYGAALERFRREDFAGTDGRGVVPPPLANRWPVSYDSFRPYYRQAERMLGVRGERDPADPDDDSDLRPPPPMSECDEQFFDIFRQAGLGPHRLHVGIDYKPGCAECLGRLCPRDCKAESANRALWPALDEHGAKLLTGFAVERLGMSGDRVTHVVGRRDGVETTIRGRLVVLAAGALNTPVILLNSKTQAWPTGVGNCNGLVGAGLMFHVLQVFALWKSADRSSAGPSKTISCRAMNEVDGDRLGGFQSFAQRVAPGQISEFLLSMVERAFPVRVPIVKLFTYAAALVGARLFRDAALFAAHTEDFAYPENRVTADADSPSGFQIAYHATKELSARSARLRRFIRARLPGRRLAWLSAPGHLNFGHPCGTCRFGESPDTSVLDPQNKVWGTANLYVVDASFFPSSAATNPGLTVAANALRVAAAIAEDWPSFGEGVARPPRVGVDVT